MSDTKHYWLYVLKLASDKYYVGITTKTPEARFKEHARGFMAAAWTRKYRPLRIHYQKDLGITEKAKAESYENKVVRRYIKKYGIDNVRGGDISITEDLVVRFGWWWSKKDWAAFTTVILLLMCLAAMSAHLLLT